MIKICVLIITNIKYKHMCAVFLSTSTVQTNYKNAWLVQQSACQLKHGLLISANDQVLMQSTLLWIASVINISKKH